MTPAEAAALVEADKQQRVKAAAEAIQATLAAYNCDLQATPTFTSDGRVVAQIVVFAK